MTASVSPGHDVVSDQVLCGAAPATHVVSPDHEGSKGGVTWALPRLEAPADLWNAPRDSVLICPQVLHWIPAYSVGKGGEREGLTVLGVLTVG